MCGWGLLRDKQSGLVCKIDLKKAYDWRDWDFPRWVLIKKGFGNRWIRWIMGCLDHPHFSVMTNGVSKEFFNSSRGICQDDPLSPFLFSLVADAFSSLMSKSMSSSLIEGIQIGREGVHVSHLLFADNIICFLKDSNEQVFHLKYILKIFETISGLKVNFSKSSLVGIGVEEGVAYHYAFSNVLKWFRV